MRHLNPKAVTLLLSAFQQMIAVANAVLLQTDEILVKPMNVAALLGIIEERLRVGAPPARVVESVATILERTTESSIDLWYARVQLEPKLMAVPLTFELRCGHLPRVFRDLVSRLQVFTSLGIKELTSEAAVEHGAVRFRQGYSGAMMAEKSRILQVSIFETLQNDLTSIDFGVLLIRSRPLQMRWIHG